MVVVRMKVMMALRGKMVVMGRIGTLIGGRMLVTMTTVTIVTLVMTVATRPAMRPVQSKNMWKLEEMRRRRRRLSMRRSR